MDYEENVPSAMMSAKSRASPTLRRLHDTLEKLLNEKEALQKRLSEELGMSIGFGLLI
jgi:hypothetical protein